MRFFRRKPAPLPPTPLPLAPLPPAPAALPTEARWGGRLADGWATFIVGEGEGHVPVTVDLANTNALMFGGSFTGKTQCGFAIAGQAVAKGWDVIVCDYGARWNSWMYRRLSVGTAASGLESTYAWLRTADGERRRRDDALTASSAASWEELCREDTSSAGSVAPMLVVFNEPSILTCRQYGASAEDEDARAEAASSLRDLLIHGPRVDVHVLLIDNQVPTRLGVDLGDHIGVRIAAGAVESTHRAMLFQEAGREAVVEYYDLQDKAIWGRALVQDDPLSPPTPTQLLSVGRDQEDLDDTLALPRDHLLLGRDGTAPRRRGGHEMV